MDHFRAGIMEARGRSQGPGSTTLLHALEGREDLSLDLEQCCLCPSIPRHIQTNCSWLSTRVQGSQIRFRVCSEHPYPLRKSIRLQGEWAKSSNVLVSWCVTVECTAHPKTVCVQQCSKNTQEINTEVERLKPSHPKQSLRG